MQQYKTFMDSYDRRYLQPKALVHVFGLSRPTISRLLARMRKSPFADGYVRLSPTLVIVAVERFQAFLRSLDGQYLRAVK